MNLTVVTVLIYAGAAILEIAGCFSLWAILRLGKSLWWIVPGLISLLLFAAVLTRANSDFAGRAYAAYGGIYIVASLVWLWAIEGHQPDRWDLIGTALCLSGALVILLGPRTAL